MKNENTNTNAVIPVRVRGKIARMAEGAGRPTRDVLNGIVEQTLHVPAAVLNSMAGVRGGRG